MCVKDVCRVKLLHSFGERLGRLESGDVVLRNNNSCVLGDITGCLGSSSLQNKATETAEINVVTTNE